jgi:hypothetical protein
MWWKHCFPIEMQPKHFCQSQKNILYFKILFNLTYITYNENIASFKVFNMSVILLLDIGLFFSNMNRAALGSSPRSHPIRLLSSLKFGGKNPVTWLQSCNVGICDQIVASS